MGKNILRGIITLITGLIIVLTLSRILLLKSEDGISQLKSYYKQKENTVDVLFLGSSHVYCDISTGVLWDEYGIAGFDLGGAEAPSFTSYYHLKEALKTQKPKVVLYEISIAAIRPTLYPPEFWVEDNNYGMKWNENRIDMLRANTLEETFPKILFPLATMHGRYTDLTENDFTDVNSSINYKGFDPREYTVPFEATDISEVTTRIACSEKAEEYLRKIIELCKSEDIPLILFTSPYPVKVEEQEIYNYMFDIGEAEGLTCLDFNKMYDAMGLDFTTDMADELHLNYAGNLKFSKFIGAYLKTNYELADRRGDANFASWEEDAKRQRIERTDLQMLLTQDSNEFIAASANAGYDSFVVFRDNGDAINDDTKAMLNSLGISNEMMVAGTAYVIKDQAVIESLTGDFRTSVQEGNDKILFLIEGEDESKTISLYVNEECVTIDYCNLIYTYDAVNRQYIGAKRF